MNDSPSPSHPPIKNIIVGLVAFLWVGFLVGGYFWGHQPFAATALKAIAQTLLAILGWLGITWLATALGALVCTRVLADETPLARLVLAAGLGLGLVSVLMGILGLLGWITATAAWLFVLLLAVVTFRHWRGIWQDMRAWPRPRPQSGFHWLILLYGSASLLMTFLIALAPIVAWDSLVYHLVGPQLFIEAGRFVHPVNIPQMGFPLLGQMQFTLGMLLVGDGVTPLLHYGYGLLTLALTVITAQRLFSASVAWLAALALLSVPTFFTLIAWPYVDVTLMFYTTAVFYAFMRWRETRTTGWLVMIGLMIGFSGGLKYTAVATPLVVSLGILWESRRDGLVASVQRLLVVGAIALALVLPWLVENALTTGNPTYPFFVAEAKFWDDWWAWWYDLPGTGLLYTDPGRLLFVPLEATIAGTEGSDFYEATIGPFILGLLFLLPFAWFKFERQEKQAAVYLLLFFGINYLLWLNGVAHTALLLRARFLFLAFGIAAILDGLILARLADYRHPQLNLPWLMQTIISLALVLTLFAYTLFFISLNPLAVISGIEDEDHYITRRIGVYHTAVTEGINQLPPGSAVVMLWEPRTYACAHITCYPDPILGEFLHLTQHEGYDAAAIAQAWQEMGASHVLLYQGGLDFLLAAADNPIGHQITPADITVLEELKQNYLSALSEWEGTYILYEINR